MQHTVATQFWVCILETTSKTPVAIWPVIHQKDNMEEIPG